MRASCGLTEIGINTGKAVQEADTATRHSPNIGATILFQALSIPVIIQAVYFLLGQGSVPDTHFINEPIE